MFLKQAGLIINFPGKEITEPLKPLFSRGDLGIMMLQIVLFIIRPDKQSKLKGFYLLFASALLIQYGSC